MHGRESSDEDELDVVSTQRVEDACEVEVRRRGHGSVILIAEPVVEVVTLFWGEREGALGLCPVGVVALDEHEVEVEPHEPQVAEHVVEGGGSAARLEASDRRLGCARGLGELALRPPDAAARLPDEVVPDALHEFSVSRGRYIAHPLCCGDAATRPRTRTARVESAIVSSPYVINVRDLVHRPGEMREREIDLDAPEKLGEGIAAVAAGEPIHLELRLEGLHEGILVTAEVDTVARGECVRCLDPVELDVQVDFQEVFRVFCDGSFRLRGSRRPAGSRTRRSGCGGARTAVPAGLPAGLSRPRPRHRGAAAGWIRAAGDAEVDPRWAALESFRESPDE